MKLSVTELLSKLLAVPVVWCLINRTILWLADYLRFARTLPALRDDEERQKRRETTLLGRFFPNRIVASGPFEGLKYPGWLACGSRLAPKLLGSYEYTAIASKVGVRIRLSLVFVQSACERFVHNGFVSRDYDGASHGDRSGAIFSAVL